MNEQEMQAQINKMGKLIEQELGEVPFLAVITFKSKDIGEFKGKIANIDRTMTISNMHPEKTPFVVFRDVVNSAKYAIVNYWNYHLNPELKNLKDVPKENEKHNMYG